MHRRAFLQAVATWAGLQVIAFPVVAARAAPRRALILIELKGGNDDLYSFPLVSDPVCAKLRPTLDVPARNILLMDARRGLHPNLAPLMDCWNAGELALVQGLSAGPLEYSHFASGQRWETGTVDRPSERLGWIARAWKEGGVEPLPGRFDATVLGFNPGSLIGGNLRLLEIDSAEMIGAAPELGGATAPSGNPTLDHLRRVAFDWGATQHVLAEAGRRMPAPALAFNRHYTGKALLGAAALLHSETPPAIVKLTVGGFDTHVAQQDRQHKIWRPFAENLLAFRSVLQQSGLWGRTTLATYSEFGRRVAENGGGTDHGGASTQLLLGGAVRGGLYGDSPDLSDLDGGNVRGTLDFRRYYNSLWSEVLALPTVAFDPARYSPLGLIRR
ncbi:DUF1501 domain-containing protein [Solimonas sp. SE-A11]|uniref:DUF1501 domain-containing protein n=1 Tax=Solimonas sp. SE-A11 TaxID=3054954 RepID=UPI00259CD670|nr:DUF1501 domain-containing protein [Solimonas sp. SE-A11]MDM4770772.1 DUF1501 domain-containing protein [Solimonas sp. SE-A11]